jgi:2-hydroxy-3-oxopropionate reductase
MKPITQENERLGFVGIGCMGRPIARKLPEFGFRLIANDRDHNKAGELVRYGGAVAPSLSELVPDLRSPAVQKLPDAQLAQIISDGKGGMPPFKSSLREDQLHSLVVHVRTLRAKK